MDVQAAESFTAPGDETGRLFVVARRAGYADAWILPIEHPARRFYRLVP